MAQGGGQSGLAGKGIGWRVARYRKRGDPWPKKSTGRRIGWARRNAALCTAPFGILSPPLLDLFAANQAENSP